MPRLLCEEELSTWDYRQYSKHLTVQHRVVTEYDLHLKLSLLSKQISSERVSEFVGEILAECEEIDDVGSPGTTVLKVIMSSISTEEDEISAS